MMRFSTSEAEPIVPCMMCWSEASSVRMHLDAAESATVLYRAPSLSRSAVLQARLSSG